MIFHRPAALVLSLGAGMLASAQSTADPGPYPRGGGPRPSAERVIAYSRAAEPDMQSMRGKDQGAESGGMSTG